MAAATTTPLEKFDSAGLRLPSAKDEARALFGLVERGSSTADAVRELIEVSPADEQRLRRIAEIEPEVAHCVLPVLRFRRRVLREFERMERESGRLQIQGNTECSVLLDFSALPVQIARERPPCATTRQSAVVPLEF